MIQDERSEFFKLDEIDRKVLFWLIAHVTRKSVKSWIEYIVEDYTKRKTIQIDAEKLYQEADQAGVVDFKRDTEGKK